MRYLIISDIHGVPTYLEQILTLFKEKHYDYLIILGDILYHGPRNAVPSSYNPSQVVELLNPFSKRIIACRGNCEAEVDQMLLAFPCLSDYHLISDGKFRFFATHGHLYTPEQFPLELGTNGIYLYGHTHLYELYQKEHLIVCNPGSLSIPKQNRPRTYASYEENSLNIMDLDGNCLVHLEL